MEHIEIRDTRNGSWYWVNTAVNACPHITPIDKTVYSALCTFAGYTEIHPSYEEISRRSSVSVRRCKESVKRLVEVGYITVITGGGKGIANIYTLLKCSKGCVSCTVTKGAENNHQTVRITTAKGADGAPHIDIDRYNKNTSETSFRVVKDSDKEEKPPKEKTDLSYRKVFELWGDYPAQWKANKTEIAAAKNLLVESNIEDMKWFLGLYEKFEKDPFCPTILKPSDMDRKWDNLLAFKKKHEQKTR